MRITSTEVQNNFGKYLAFASASEEIIITKNGKDIARLVPFRKDSAEEQQCICENEGKPKINYEDFIKLTEKSDKRYELIDGELFLLNSPSYAHQTAISGILSHLHGFFRTKKGTPISSPFEVTLVKGDNRRNVVQPDILVICDTEKIDEEGRYWGVPTLVVEVLSPSSLKHDMLIKLNLYSLTGVKEFWLVDAAKKAIYLYSFHNKGIDDFISFTNRRPVRSNVFEGLEIPLEDIFL